MSCTRHESNTTPPSSFTATPLTPPPSEQKPSAVLKDILDEIGARKSGFRYSEQSWLCYHLSSIEYKDLEERLRSDGFATDTYGIEHNSLTFQIRLLSLTTSLRASDALCVA
jgi:hypothetical protein